MKSLKEKDLYVLTKRTIKAEFHKVTLKKLALRLKLEDAKFVRYRKLKDDKSILFYAHYESCFRILGDGTFVSHLVITHVMYTKVKELKKYLIYNHSKDTLDYSDDYPDTNYTDTKVFLTNDLPDSVVDMIVKKILEIEEGEKN